MFLLAIDRVGSAAGEIAGMDRSLKLLTESVKYKEKSWVATHGSVLRPILTVRW